MRGTFLQLLLYELSTLLKALSSEMDPAEFRLIQ